MMVISHWTCNAHAGCRPKKRSSSLPAAFSAHHDDDLGRLLGAMPLAIGFGEGSELRRPLGIALLAALLLSQLLTLYTTPVVYLYMDRFRLWCLPRSANVAQRLLAADGVMRFA